MLTQEFNIDVDEILAVELNENCKAMSQHANPADGEFPGVNHGWKTCSM